MISAGALLALATAEEVIETEAWTWWELFNSPAIGTFAALFTIIIGACLVHYLNIRREDRHKTIEAKAIAALFLSEIGVFIRDLAVMVGALWQDFEDGQFEANKTDLQYFRQVYVENPIALTSSGNKLNLVAIVRANAVVRTLEFYGRHQTHVRFLQEFAPGREREDIFLRMIAVAAGDIIVGTIAVAELDGVVNGTPPLTYERAREKLHLKLDAVDTAKWINNITSKNLGLTNPEGLIREFNAMIKNA